MDINTRYYAEWSAGRDDYFRKMAAPRLRVATFLDLIAERVPESLVDLGCGNGQLLGEIHRRHPTMRLTGIDFSEPQITLNRKRLPGISWLTVDLARPLGPGHELAGRFEAAVASEIIEHVETPEVLARNALWLVRPGTGRLLLSTQSGRVHETERRVGHRRHFSMVDMRELLERAGWTDVRAWNCGFPFQNLAKWMANLAPDLAMAQFGRERYGVRQHLVCLALRVAFRLNSTRRGAQLFAVAERPADAGP